VYIQQCLTDELLHGISTYPTVNWWEIPSCVFHGLSSVLTVVIHMSLMDWLSMIHISVVTLIHSSVIHMSHITVAVIHMSDIRVAVSDSHVRHQSGCDSHFVGVM